MEMNNELRDMKRKYFVVFDYWKANDTRGMACTVVERELPVSGWDDILSMMDCILSRNPDMKEIVISNWRRFEEPE
jgi:hypothetical protein